jgi:copper(I)-binding protein
VADPMIRILFLVAALAAFPSAAIAHDFQIGAIHIEHPWARATPKGAAVGGGYMKITNRGTTTDRLIGGSFSTAKRVLIHQMKMDGNVMRMRVLDQGVEIKPADTVEFSPESLHIMFEGLREPLVQGHRVKGTLIFEKAGPVEVEYVVEGMGARAAPEAPNSPHGH